MKLLDFRNGLSIGSALPIVLPNSNFDVHWPPNKEKRKIPHYPGTQNRSVDSIQET